MEVVESLTVGWRPMCRHYEGAYRTLPRSRDRRKRARQDAIDTLPVRRRPTGGWWGRALARPGADTWPTEPALVLDPFVGVGTAGLVARRLFRRFIGVDLKAEYAAAARRRIAGDMPLFNAVEAEEEPSDLRTEERASAIG